MDGADEEGQKVQQTNKQTEVQPPREESGAHYPGAEHREWGGGDLVWRFWRSSGAQDHGERFNKAFSHVV